LFPALITVAGPALATLAGLTAFIVPLRSGGLGARLLVARLIITGSFVTGSFVTGSFITRTTLPTLTRFTGRTGVAVLTRGRRTLVAGRLLLAGLFVAGTPLAILTPAVLATIVLTPAALLAAFVPAVATTTTAVLLVTTAALAALTVFALGLALLSAALAVASAAATAPAASAAALAGFALDLDAGGLAAEHAEESALALFDHGDVDFFFAGSETEQGFADGLGDRLAFTADHVVVLTHAV